MSPDDPRRDACRSAVYAAPRQICQTKLHLKGRGTAHGLAWARMEARAALAECDRLAMDRGRR